MAGISNYGELKDAVKAYLHRTDMDAQIPTFISLGISKINRECMSRHQEQIATYTAPAGSSIIALPTRYKAMRSVTADGRPLRQITLQNKENRYLDTSGAPQYYSISDNRLNLQPAPDDDVDLRMTYYETVQDFSADTESHPLLLANPNIFIYAAMREAAPFLHGDERQPMWAELLAQEIIGENNYSEESRWSGSPLEIESQYIGKP
jgi:hypothetical protein